MKDLNYKLNKISRFLLGMIIAFFIGGTMSYVSTLKNCNSENCGVLVCTEEGDWGGDYSKTGQSGYMCNKYDIEYYPAKKYILKETITNGIVGALGLGLLIGGIWAGNYKRKDKI